MKPDDALDARIHDLTHDGRGVADLNGRRVFVPGALPDERVVLRARRRRRKYQEAELVDIIERAADRTEPGCEYFGRCGGCALQHLAYPAQIAFKTSVVAEALTRIGGLAPAQWLPAITGSQWRYRRRARLGVKYVAGKERVLVGFRERAAPYVTDMRHCPILVPPMDSGIGELADVIHGSTIRHRIPQAEVSIGDEGGALVLRVLDPPSDADVGAFGELGKQLGLDIYLQRGGPGSLELIGDEPRTLAYRLDDFGLRFEFAPTDFVQINAEINAAMVRAAVDEAGIETGDRILDLYCGLGNFSLPLARRAGEVLGVEGDGGLVARAARNAAHNGIGNARFLAADLAETDWPFFREPWDIVFLDPARTGAEAAVASMARMAPRRIVYVSCHPGTLARDGGVLVSEHGYFLESVRVLDMFPHTHHVEAVAVFERRSK